MCTKGCMNALFTVFISTPNSFLTLQIDICPVHGSAAPVVPWVLSSGATGLACSPGLLSSTCPPTPRLTGWSAGGVTHERQACLLCGLSSPWHLPPVLWHQPLRLRHISPYVDAGRGVAMLSRPTSVLNPYQCFCLPHLTTSSLILYLYSFKLIPSLTCHRHLLPPSHPNTLPSTLNSYHTQYG